MKNFSFSYSCVILLLVVCTFSATAQTTVIPDPAFEQELINQNIDSDGVVNGQVLTSDVENITELTIEGNINLTDLTGIEAFINLEELTVRHAMLTQLDVSQNLNLRSLICENNMISSLTVNPLLEQINLSNGDVGPPNEVTELDFSNCPNINYIRADGVPLDKINLKNGNNNPNMVIDVSMWIADGPPDPNAVDNTVCIEVDDVAAAQANQFPYSEWTIYDTEAAYFFAEDCALGTATFHQDDTISIYPNPTSHMLYFNTNGVAIDRVVLYDISGRVIKEYREVTAAGISVSGLAKGMYVVQISSGNHTQTEKIIVE